MIARFFGGYRDDINPTRAYGKRRRQIENKLCFETLLGYSVFEIFIPNKTFA